MSLMDALLLDPYAIDLSRAEVWIAVRTDGVAGSGTQNDPYDGSTQAKFDGLFLPPNGILTHCTYMRIHLGPGTLQTSGYSPSMNPGGVAPGEGWKIIGSGMEVTVLQLVGAGATLDNGTTAAVGNIYAYTQKYFEVSDLTIDCNVGGQANQKVVCTAVNISGAHNRLRRIRAINFGSQTQLAPPLLQIECFPIIATSAGTSDDTYVDCWIDNCILEQPGFNNTGMTTLMNVAGGENAQYLMGYHRACGIRNCFVDSEYRTNPVPIASIVISGGVATVTTRLPHGLSNTAWVRISGAVLSGNTNNSYNGSYPISGVTSPYVFTYVPNPTQTVNPTGDIWIGRFPSQLIWIASFGPPSGSGPYTAQVTTNTPHFRIPGDMVAVNFPGTPPNIGQVSSVSSPTQFTYTTEANPGTISYESLGVVFQACQADAGTAAVVEGNRFLNVANGGPYHDTYSSKDIIARNNYLRGVQLGPSWSLGGTDLGYYPPDRTCNLTNSGTQATLTTSDGSAHGLAFGEVIQVQNAYVNNILSLYYNGFFTVTPDPMDLSKLTYQMAGNPGGNSDTSPSSHIPTFARLFQEGRIVIENNFIELGLGIFGNGFDPTTAIWFFNNNYPTVVPPWYLFNQVVLRRNLIHSLEGAADPFGYPTGVRLDMCANGIVEESVIDLNSLHNPAIWQVRSNSITYLNNQTSAGALIQGQIYETSQFAEELATLIDLACVQSS